MSVRVARMLTSADWASGSSSVISTRILCISIGCFIHGFDARARTRVRLDVGKQERCSRGSVRIDGERQRGFFGVEVFETGAGVGQADPGAFGRIGSQTIADAQLEAVIERPRGDF